MLLMKRRYFEAVRTGRKTTTLRYWRQRRVRPGSVHWVPGLGRVRVDAVRPVAPESLTDADARADGFASAAELRAALAEMYPSVDRDGRTLYQVHFRFLGEENTSAP